GAAARSRARLLQSGGAGWARRGGAPCPAAAAGPAGGARSRRRALHPGGVVAPRDFARRVDQLLAAGLPAAERLQLVPPRARVGASLRSIRQVRETACSAPDTYSPRRHPWRPRRHPWRPRRHPWRSRRAWNGAAAPRLAITMPRLAITAPRLAI